MANVCPGDSERAPWNAAANWSAVVAWKPDKFSKSGDVAGSHVFIVYCESSGKWWWLSSDAQVQCNAADFISNMAILILRSLVVGLLKISTVRV